jgi:hypothetical protein
MDNKVIVALVSVGVGWCLSQLTEIVKSKVKNRQLKNVLRRELDDILFKLIKSREYCVNFSKALNAGNNFDFIPLKVKTLVYDNYYPEIYASYKQPERIALSAIYGQLEQLNNLLDNFSPKYAKQHYIQIFQVVVIAQGSIKQFFKDPSKELDENKEKITAINSEIENYKMSIFAD